MHPLFAVEDILDEIFGWLSRHECTVVAKVNKTWFRSAIPFIWRELSLAQGLSPSGMQTDFEGEYCFSNWDRFLIYSPYVRVLYIFPENSILLQIAIGVRPRSIQYLFPNCQALNWTVGSNDGFANPSILIPPSIRHLRFSLHTLPLPFFDLLGRTLVTRLPALHSLGIDVRDETMHPQCQNIFNQLFRFFSPSLRWVKIPNTLVTETTVQMLSQASTLSRLRITHNAELEISQPSMAYSNYSDGFDHLEILSFSGSQSTLYNTFLDRFKLSSLTSLRWVFDIYLEDIHFERLVHAVVSNCPQLVFLEVGKPPHPWSGTLQANFLPSIAWRSIRPLLACKSLSSLILNCVQVPNDTEELKDLLVNRKTWEEITLLTTTPLKLDDIILFAMHCPKLMKLGVFLDVSIDAGPVPKVEPGISFPTLHQIDFFDSLFTRGHTFELSKFLYDICETLPYLGGWDIRFWASVASTIDTCYSQPDKRKPQGPDLHLYIDDHVCLERQMAESALQMGVLVSYKNYRVIYSPPDNLYDSGSESDFEEEDSEIFLHDAKSEPVLAHWI